MSRWARLVAGSAATAAVALLLPGAAAAQEARVGTAGPGRVAFSFVGRIEQNGPLAVDVGFLTSVEGLDEGQLFTGDDPLARDEATARFTYFASARLEHRSVNGNLFVTGGTAETVLFLQPDGGADFEDPASFRRGTEIATFESRWFDVINVQAPDEGIARVESDDVQLTASPFELDGEPLVFGRAGDLLRLSFTGQGTRSQVEPPRATILYAGEASGALDAAAPVGGEDGEEAAGDDSARATSGWVWLALGAALVALALSVAAVVLAARRRAP